MQKNIESLVRQTLPADSSMPNITHVRWKDEQFQVMERAARFDIAYVIRPRRNVCRS